MSIALTPAVKQKLAKTGQLDVGQFHLLNMDMMKIAAGDGWPAMRKKVYEASAQFIAKRLKPEHVLVPCEEGFLLVLGDEDPQAAQYRIERLGKQLKEFFLGTPVLASLGLRCEAKSVTPDRLAELAAEASKTGPKHIPLPEHAAFKPGFRPVWDAQKSVIGANMVEPLCEVDGRERLARDAVGARLISNDQADLDAFTARTAIAGLRQIAQIKGPAPMRFSVHFESLLRADARQSYLSVLGVAPKPMRRFFQLMLDCPPLQSDQTLALLRELRDFGVTTVLEIPLAEQSEMGRFALAGIGIYQVPAPVNEDKDGDGILERHRGALARLVDAAKAQRAWTHLDDVRDTKAIKDAVGVGTRFLSGRVIGGHQEDPISPRGFSMIDLVQGKRAA